MHNEDFYKDLIDNLYDGVYFVNRNREITYWNKGAERITGYRSGQVIGKSCRENLLNHVNAEGVQLCLTNCPLTACMVDGDVRVAEVYLHHADGHRLPVMIRISPLKDADGSIIGAVETFSNNSELMEMRRQLRQVRHQARIDGLTGIGNRLNLVNRLRAAIAEFEAQEIHVGLIFVDVDRFKEINDTCGHEAGDRILKMVAKTLRNNLRASDIVGRWGGDEFIAIVQDVESKDVLSGLADKLRLLVGTSRLDLEDRSLVVTISAGATMLVSDDSPESAIRRADDLMYQSKRSGRNRITVG